MKFCFDAPLLREYGLVRSGSGAFLLSLIALEDIVGKVSGEFYR